MTFRKSHSFRHLNYIAALVVAALIAAACGSDDVVAPEPATTTDAATTTQPSVASGTTTSVEEPDADAEEGSTVGTDAPSGTTTTVVEADQGESAVIADETDDVPADETDDVPADEPVSDDGDLATPATTVPSNDAPVAEAVPDPEQGQAQPDAPTTEDSTEDTTSLQPEPEPEGVTTDAIVCIRDADGVLGCPQVVPDDYSCENVAGDLLCRPPGAQPGPEQEADPVPQPEGSTDDDIVCVRQSDGLLSCSQEPPADYWCENVGDTLVCHPPDTKPEPEQTPQTGWTPPVAGAVPEVHVDTPLPEWQRGDGTVNPDGRAYDYPRPTQRTVSWADWCSGAFDSCRWLLHEMYQALDYLGADPQCVLNIYTQRVNYYLSQGSGANASYASNTLGWHLCATVIDPIVGDLPAERPDTDVGLRLSDTPGITLADRCRVVLTDPFPDIQLETRGSVNTPPVPFGDDCDAWGAYVEGKESFSSYRACAASLSLAEEWMEHHHNQNERYHRPHC